jgi:hypothetical protein
MFIAIEFKHLNQFYRTYATHSGKFSSGIKPRIKPLRKHPHPRVFIPSEELAKAMFTPLNLRFFYRLPVRVRLARHARSVQSFPVESGMAGRCLHDLYVAGLFSHQD